jgi:release factor glutamine methyltransferase
MHVAQALQHAQALGLSRIDAQVLLLHTLGQATDARAWLLAHDQDPLNDDQQQRWQACLQRRLNGEPVAYITGEKEFFGLPLHVDARVLDPRPDTETLVTWALALLPEGDPSRVLDVGTGSGAVALAVQQACPQAHVWALDTSVDALDVARRNAQRLGLPVQFIHSDWFAGIDAPSQATGHAVPARFDLIVSNPPYIAEHDPHLPALAHEPLLALTSGPDGLDAIRHIVATARTHLVPHGWLLLEHGHDQGDAVCALLRAAGFAHVQSRNDLAGIHRCSGGQHLSVE